jgi:hypothetical protein
MGWSVHGIRVRSFAEAALAFWQQQVEAAAKIGAADEQVAALVQVREYERRIARLRKGHRGNDQR